MSERRCIVTAEELPKTAMVRFVVGPEGQIVPDVAEKLPGRGIWVKAEKALINQAVQKKLFARAAKAPVKAEAGLAELTGRLLRMRALDWIKLCRAAGLAVGGFDKVERLLRDGKAAFLLHAHEAAKDGCDKLNRLAGQSVAVIGWFSLDELGEAFAHPNLVHAAIKPGGPADELGKSCARLAGFVEKTAI